MKTLFVLALLSMAVTAAAGDAPHHAMKTASGWFDMENCVFCKNLVEDPALLEHMQWENHNVANGAVCITVVDPAYAASYGKAMSAMEALGQKMHSGEVDPTKVKMCGHCAEYGHLLMSGVAMENVDGEAANVTLMTSSDPQVVARIHEYTDRTNREMGEMMASGHAH